MRLDGKVAIVTGGGGGIGSAVAAGLAEEGARVWVADIAMDAASRVATQIGPRAQAIELDVVDLSSILKIVRTVDESEGGIDILVNCAGVYGTAPWLQITKESHDRIFAVNTRGLLLMTQAVSAVMIIRDKGGAIVNIASGAGRRGNPTSVSYSASKAAVISLTQSAASALAPHRIRVNAIAPGPVDTPMWGSVLAHRSALDNVSKEMIEQAMAERIPLGRISMPSEHVGAIIYLVSDAGSYVTGQTLNIDGGMFMN